MMLPPKVKNVLIIDNSEYLTGAAKSISKFALELERDCNFFWAVTNKISDQELLEVTGNRPAWRFEFVEISRRLAALLRYFPTLLRNARKIERLIRDNDISIVHVNDCYNMCGVAVKLLNKRIKLVYHVRLLQKSYIGPLYGTYLWVINRYADAIVCCSSAVAVDVGDTRTPKFIIYDSERFEEELATTVGIREMARRIVYVGNILPGKGQDLAIKALGLVASEFPELSMHFVGKWGHNEISTNFKNELDVLINANGLRARVTFDGFRVDVDSEIRKADIALNLSESESFSMVCLEALKCGVPLIASDCGGPAELFEHMRSGWLVPNRDFSAAAEAIRAVASERELRAGFAREGQTYVFGRFDVVKNGRILFNLYQQLIKS